MGKVQGQSKMIRFMKMPFKILGKARDLYVRSMTSCAAKGSYGHAVGYHGVDYASFPKSFSVGAHRSSDADDFNELVKVASRKSLDGKVEVDAIFQEHLRQSVSQIGSKDLPKSCSVQMGRIDEDKTCEFEEDGGVSMAVYPRSRSCAVVRRTGS